MKSQARSLRAGLLAPRHPLVHLIALAAVASFLCATAGAAAAMVQAPGPHEAFGHADTRPAPVAKALRLPASQRLGVQLESVPVVALPPLDAKKLLSEDAARAPEGGRKLLRVGVTRPLKVTWDQGRWYSLPGGAKVWAVEVVSPSAVAVRLHLAGFPAGAAQASDATPAQDAATGVPVTPATPETLEIALYRPDQPVAEPGSASPGRMAFYEAQNGQIAGRWTSAVIGERVRLEVYLPAGWPAPAAIGAAGAAQSGAVIDQLLHFYTDPVSGTSPGIPKQAGPCHNDVTCFPQWADVARAVALLEFIDSGSAFLCTGELLNSQASDQTPYFLTAHHCISTQQVAATAELFWRYQTAVCNGSPPSIDSVPTSSVATLLATGVPSDFTLLMINGALPRNVFWAGWTGDPIADGTASATIHHPSGDYKRISFGNKASNTTCGGSDHVRINWTSGPTEPGSSGSGTYRDDTQQLYGQLDCGDSACGNVTDDDFGAFSTSYKSISSLLTAGSDDDSEPNDSCNIARLARVGTLNQRIVKSTSPDWYRVRVPAGATAVITLSFVNADGDIDAALFDGCGGNVLARATGRRNVEVLTYTNSSSNMQRVWLQVYLHLGTRNTYALNVSFQ